MKLSKRIKEARSKIDATKTYTVAEAVGLLKETSKVKFDAGVEIHINTGIDPKKSDQLIRGSVSLPHGTGKKIRIAAFVPDADAKNAKEAGAEIVGADSLIEEIKKTEKCDFDIAVATPDMMKKLASVARILGQKGLMPNPKTGTITTDPAKTIKELSQGKISFKNDNGGTVHALIGKVSFDPKLLTENAEQFIDAVKKTKPDTVKGTFVRSIYMASSMSPSIKVSV